MNSKARYFFDSHTRDSRGLSVADVSSILLKFGNILQLENYNQVAHLEYHGRDFKTVFSVTIWGNEVTDVLIHIDTRFVPSQRKVRNNGVNRKKYTEHELLNMKN